nr:ribosomal protein S2 [Cyanidiaceae sp.]
MNGDLVSLSELLDASAHIGHGTSKWNPKFFPFIHMTKKGIHIIDLIKTIQQISKACLFLRKEIRTGKKVLFVGTKNQASNIVEREAKKCQEFYINQRWPGGLLTNWPTIKLRLKKLQLLEEKERLGYFNNASKKEEASVRREIQKLNKYLSGIKGMEKPPDIIIIVDPAKESTTVSECYKLKIPTIGILDSNCNPESVNIPIPANDDSIKTIDLILSKLSTDIYISKLDNNQFIENSIRS